MLSCALVLVFVTTTVPAYAASHTKAGMRVFDAYAEKRVEVAMFEGVEYVYEYSYNDNGNRVIAVTDSSTGITGKLH